MTQKHPAEKLIDAIIEMYLAQRERECRDPFIEADPQRGGQSPPLVSRFDERI